MTTAGIKLVEGSEAVADLRRLATEADLILQDALRALAEAEVDGNSKDGTISISDSIKATWPVSTESHTHSRDLWTTVEISGGTAVTNSAPYAEFVWADREPAFWLQCIKTAEAEGLPQVEPVVTARIRAIIDPGGSR